MTTSKKHPHRAGHYDRLQRHARREAKKAVCVHTYLPREKRGPGQMWDQVKVTRFPSMRAVRQEYGPVPRHLRKSRDSQAPKLWGGVFMQVRGDGKTRYGCIHRVGDPCRVVVAQW